MKTKKLFLLLMLAFCMLTTSLAATPSLDPDYVKAATRYVSELQQIQKQIFSLAQKAIFSTPETATTFQAEFNTIRRNLVTVADSIYTLADSLPVESREKTNTLLLFNSINLLGSALNELNLINQSEAIVDKTLLLDNYFRFRLQATDTLNFISKLLAQ